MNKTEINHIQSRLRNVVRCTTGKVHTILNNQLFDTDLSKEEKFNLIVNGEATLLGKDALFADKSASYKTRLERLLECYAYPVSEERQAKIDWNERIIGKRDELCHKIELESRRILDEFILGLIAKQDIPKTIEVLSEMHQAANTVVKPAEQEAHLEAA